MRRNLTGIILCEYPAGYVEPRVEFWEAMRVLAEATATDLMRLGASGTIQVPDPRNPGGPAILVSLAARRTARVQHCQNFAAKMGQLRDLAAKELAGVPFTDAETLFVRSTMNAQDHPYLGKTFDGWFPGLFYKDYGALLPSNTDINASDRRDELVTDVHTAPPDPVWPGGVLHEAVGAVDLVLIAVDSGTDRMVYAGPTLSHYEFTAPGLRRYTDGEWVGLLYANPRPARPSWTRDYLVPR